MNKKILMPIAFMILFSLAILVSAINWAGETQATFYKGWNLVYGLQSPEQLDAGRLEESDIKAIYAFIPTTQQYLRAWPNPDKKEWENLNNIFDDHELLQTAFWVYSDKTVEGSFNGVPHATEYWLYELPKPVEQRPLYKGWNFMAVTPDIAGKTQGEINGDCNFERLYIWNPEAQKWINWPVNKNDEVERDWSLYGMPIVIKVSDDCTLGSSEITGPPALP